MKKILFAVLVTISIFASAFAQDEALVNSKIMNTFEDEFPQATAVDWKAGPAFTQASFTLDGKRMNTFYDVFNQKIGTTYQVAFENLSKRAKAKIAKKYAGYTITEVISFECDAEDCHYVSVENGLQRVILKVSSDMVKVFQKSKIR